MNTRRAELSDVESIACLFDLYRQFYEKKGDIDEARIFIHERIKLHQSVVFVAEEDGQALGFAQMYPSFSSLAMAPIWILNDLFVHSNSRRKGSASALLNACTEFGRVSGAKRLSLQTARMNESAKALYEASGWVQDTNYLTYSLNLDHAK